MRQQLIQYLHRMYNTNGLSLEDKSVPPIEDQTNLCQGCSNSFNNPDVMIVDDLGPMCFRCLHNLAQKVLG